MKDIFLTTAYKDGHIHSCYDRDMRRFEYQAQYNCVVVTCISAFACKLWITKMMKVVDKRDVL